MLQRQTIYIASAAGIKAEVVKACMQRLHTKEAADARIVCFTDALQKNLDTSYAVAKWTETVAQAVYMELWYKAYREVERLMAMMNESAGGLVRTYYHHLAEMLLKCLVLDVVLKRGEPSLVIVPPAPKFAYVGFGVPVRRAGTWINYLLLNALDLPRWIGMGRQAFANLWGRVQRWLKNDSAVTRMHHERAVVVVVVEDGVSGVNLEPTMAVLRELCNRGYMSVVITTNPKIRHQVKKLGVEVIFCGYPLLRLALLPAVRTWWRARRELVLFEKRHDLPPAVSAFIRLFRARVTKFVLYRETVLAQLSQISGKYSVNAVLAVNEGSPSAVVALEWAKRRGIPNFGYWPVLVGDRPDYHFFPASSHLVYGDQLKERLVALGIEPGSVKSVGSTTYDRARGRDRARDIEATRREYVKGWQVGEQLVVIGTEALPNAFDEMSLVLQAISKISGVHTVIKVHPADSLEDYQRRVTALSLATSVQVIQSCDLLALLHASDLLICVMSNIAITAAVLGTPTLVCDFANRRRALDLVEEGLCLGCFEPSQLRQTIEKMLRDPETRNRCKTMMTRGLARFNGPNDGNSHARIVDELIGARAKTSPMNPYPLREEQRLGSA